MSSWHSASFWLVGVLGFVLTAVFSVSLFLSLRLPVRSLWYRKPELPEGWELEKLRDIVQEGSYWLVFNLVRAPAIRLAPGSLVIRCSQPITRADFRLPFRTKSGSESERRICPPLLDNLGTVALPVPEIQADRPFYFDGSVRSDLPFKLWQVKYRPDTAI